MNCGTVVTQSCGVLAKRGVQFGKETDYACYGVGEGD
jgi:hypothetical protein